MIFGENPFFTNRLLVKEFHLENEAETDESVLSKSIGTEIDWIQGKNVMKSMCVRRQRNKRKSSSNLNLIVQELVKPELFVSSMTDSLSSISLIPT